MSGITMEAARLMESLPEVDKQFILEFIKKMVIAWDPDFTKVTAEEKERIETAENSGFVDENEIDWENVGIDEWELILNMMCDPVDEPALIWRAEKFISACHFFSPPIAFSYLISADRWHFLILSPLTAGILLSYLP